MPPNFVSLLDGPHPEGFTWISGNEKGARVGSSVAISLDFHNLLMNSLSNISQYFIKYFPFTRGLCAAAVRQLSYCLPLMYVTVIVFSFQIYLVFFF